jgi:hypothetical protein
MPTAAIDPNAALALLRELVARTRSADTDRTDLGVLAKTLAEEIGAVDTWLSAGGDRLEKVTATAARCGALGPAFPQGLVARYYDRAV